VRTNAIKHRRLTGSALDGDDGVVARHPGPKVDTGPQHLAHKPGDFTEVFDLGAVLFEISEHLVEVLVAQRERDRSLVDKEPVDGADGHISSFGDHRRRRWGVADLGEYFLGRGQDGLYLLFGPALPGRVPEVLSSSPPR